MRINKFSLLAILAIAVLALPAPASVIYTGAPIPTFTFDGMPTTTPGVSPFVIVPPGAQAVVTGSGGWEGTKLSGTGTAAMPYIATDGTSNTGGIHSLGATGVGERALGGTSSAGNIPGFGIEVVNNTPHVQFEVRIDFTQENWRTSTNNVNTFQASYATSDSVGVTSANYLSVLAGFTDIDVLDLVGPAPVASNGALNGNLLANQVGRSAVITGLAIDPGQSFFLRFQDANDVGNDATLAIDNFNIALIPEPASIALMLGCVGAMLIRRK